MSTVITNSVLAPGSDKVMLRKSGCIVQNEQYEYSSVYEDLNSNNLINMPGDLGNGNATITPYFGDSKILFTAMIQVGLFCFNCKGSSPISDASLCSSTYLKSDDFRLYPRLSMAIL